MPRDTIHVMHDRTVYQIPIDRFGDFCRDGAAGKHPQPGDYGHQVAIVSYVTDGWSGEDYNHALQQEGNTND